MMERFAEYAKNKEIDSDSEEMASIYEKFKKTMQNIFDSKKYKLNRCLNLMGGFMNFTVNFYKNKKEYINEIL